MTLDEFLHELRTLKDHQSLDAFHRVMLPAEALPIGARPSDWPFVPWMRPNKDYLGVWLPFFDLTKLPFEPSADTKIQKLMNPSDEDLL